MLCAGNALEFCGGPNRLNLYNYTGTDLPQVTNPNPNPGAGAGAGIPTAVKHGLPEGWKYASCYMLVLVALVR